MKIRLLGGYWPDFTGKYGFIDFVDGVAEVSASDAEYLRRLVVIEDVRDCIEMCMPSEDKCKTVSAQAQQKNSKLVGANSKLTVNSRLASTRH